MMDYYQIYRRVKLAVPAALLDKYEHLTYGEMAEVKELAPWADILLEAEKEWAASAPEGFA